MNAKSGKFWALFYNNGRTYLLIQTSNLVLKGASKNSEFAQMQGAGKILQRDIRLICKQEISPATQKLG